LPGGRELSVRVKHELVDDVGLRALHVLEAGEVGLLEDDVDPVGAPHLDVVVVADDLLDEGEPRVLGHSVEERLERDALSFGEAHDEVGRDGPRVGLHELAEDDLVDADGAGEVDVAEEVLQRGDRAVHEHAREADPRASRARGADDGAHRVDGRTFGVAHQARVGVVVRVSAADVEVHDAGAGDPVDDALALSDVEEAGPVGRDGPLARAARGEGAEDARQARVLARLAAGHGHARPKAGLDRIEHALERREPSPVVRLGAALRRELLPARGGAQLLDAERTARVARLRAVDAEVGVGVDVARDAVEVDAHGAARGAVFAKVEGRALGPPPGVDEGGHGSTRMAAERASSSGPRTRPSGFTKRKSRPTRKGSSHDDSPSAKP
jgi:hypothetical protein